MVDVFYISFPMLLLYLKNPCENIGSNAITAYKQIPSQQLCFLRVQL